MPKYEITTTLGTQRALANLAIQCNNEYPGSVSDEHLDWARTIVNSEMQFDEAMAIADLQGKLVFDIARVAYQSFGSKQEKCMDLAAHGLSVLNHLRESAPITKELVEDPMITIRDQIEDIALTRGKFLPNRTLSPDWAVEIIKKSGSSD